MTYYCTSSATGTLLDIDVAPPSDLAPGLVLTVAEGPVPDRYFYVGDRNAREFVRRPDVERVISVLQYLNKFYAAERITIKDLAKTNSGLADYMDMLDAAEYVDLDDPITLGGLHYLCYLGVLDAELIQEILK